MRCILAVVTLLVVAVSAKEGKEGAIGHLSKAQSQYARAQACSKKGMLILEGMKMEKVKTENMVSFAEAKGGEELKKALKLDSLMKMALSGFQQKMEAHKQGLEKMQNALNNHMDSELDREAEKEYEQFKNKFELHSSLMEEHSDVQSATKETTGQFESLEETRQDLQRHAAEAEVQELLEAELSRQARSEAESLAQLEQAVRSRSAQTQQHLESLKAEMQQQKVQADTAVTTTTDAQVANAMAISSEIDMLVDEAIMEYLLNPPPTSISAAPSALSETDNYPLYMNHHLVKLKQKDPIFINPVAETQTVLFDKVLKDINDQGKIAIASVDLDSYKQDSKVQMYLLCLKTMTDKVMDQSTKLFLDVHGGTRQRRDRVKSMAKLYLKQAEPLDKVKNYKAEEYTYKLADSIFKMGEFGTLESQDKLSELQSTRAYNVLADTAAPADQMCGMDGNMGAMLKQQDEARKTSTSRTHQQDAITAAFAHKPYFGHTSMMQENTAGALSQQKAMYGSKEAEKKSPAGLSPTMRRASR